MKILVVEHSERNQRSASETLSDHEIFIAKSFDEAMDALEIKVDYSFRHKILTDAGFPNKPYNDEDAFKRYRKALDEATEKATTRPSFDAVLTGMMLPMSPKKMDKDAFNPKELIPYGFIIVMRAALVGIKYVAVVTTAGKQHRNAMSAALKHISSGVNAPANFIINGSKATFVHAPMICEIPSGKPGPIDRRKDWGAVLEDLLIKT